MPATQSALDYLVLAQLARLRHDQARLERLYAQLTNDGSYSTAEEQFMALWSDLDGRASRLERMLNELAPARTLEMPTAHRMPMQAAANPTYRPAA